LVDNADKLACAHVAPIPSHAYLPRYPELVDPLLRWLLQLTSIASLNIRGGRADVCSSLAFWAGFMLFELNFAYFRGQSSPTAPSASVCDVKPKQKCKQSCHTSVSLL